MRINKTSNYTGFKITKPEEYIRSVDADLTNLFLLSQGRIRFYGIASDNAIGENIAGEFQTFTSSADALTQNTVAHGVGSVPVGYLTMKQNKSASLYTGASAWTSTNVYLISSATSTTYTIFLVK